mgnify:FL=1|jgi:hypothetical protein
MIKQIDNVPEKVLEYLKTGHGQDLINHNLVGQMQKEFEYKDVPEYVSDFILRQTQDPMFTDYLATLNILSSNKQLYLQKLWINYQGKHEFNPVHHHSGVFSFIIFIKIPYNLEDEDKVFPKTGHDYNATSRLVFYMINQLGRIFDLPVHVDKSYEGKMLMFPSFVQHGVYPFYTSDDYRITVSGNVSVNVE